MAARIKKWWQDTPTRVLKANQWQTNREALIRVPIIFALVGLAIYLFFRQDNVVLYFRDQLPQRIGFSPDEIGIRYLEVIGLIVVYLGIMVLLMTSILAIRFRLSVQIRRRLARAYVVTFFLILLASLFGTLSSYFAYLGEPQSSGLIFASAILAGLTTEIMGSLVQADWFAKIWEENEEADKAALVTYTENQTLKTRLTALVAELEQAQASYQEQADKQARQHILTRMTMPSHRSSAFYAGQANGITEAINATQKLLAELENKAAQ
jgi:hypothetical protein